MHEKRAQEVLLKRTAAQKNRKEDPPEYTAVLLSSTRMKIFPSTKEISTYLYDKEGSKFLLRENQWEFSILEYNGLVDVVGKYIKSAPPQKVINILAEKIKKKESNIDREKIVAVLVDRQKKEKPVVLHDFQIAGVVSAVERGYRILIADDMGLGKTIQSISIVKTYLETHSTDKSLLIIAETTNCNMWESMARKYISDRVMGIKEFIREAAGGVQRFAVVVDTYRKISEISEHLMPEMFFMGIVDESQCLKNIGSQRTQKLVPFLTKVPHVVLLSGTPALSRPAELYTQICIVYPYLYGYTEYHERYCRVEEKYLNAVEKRFKRHIMYTGGKNLDELKIVTETLILIRRLKSGCISLGEKRRVKVVFQTELVNRESIALKALGEKLPNQGILQEFNQSAEEKTKDVIKFVQQIRRESSRKIVIFAFHKGIIQEIYDFYRKRAVKIDGDTPKAQREELCKRFREDPGIDIAVLSIKTCSTGITLVCASVVIFAELSWTPGDHLQAEDRIYRIGQTESVRIYYLIASYFDKKLWPRIHRKISVLNKIGIADKSSMVHEELMFDPKQAMLQS